MRTFLLEYRGRVPAVVAVVVVTSIAGAAGIAVRAQGNPEAAKVTNPVAATPESIAAGKQVYTRYCAVCHGTSGEGEIFFVIKNGVPPDPNMEPWGDRIKDPDIWNVVNYVRSLAKK